MKAILAIFALAFAVSGTSFAENKPPYNEKCPVCGKDGRLIFHSESQGKRILFATADCKKKFDASPTKYKVTPKDK